MTIMNDQNLTGNVSRRSRFKGAAGATLLAGAGVASGGIMAGAPAQAATTATQIRRVKDGALTYELITTAPQNLHKIYQTNFNYSTFSGKTETLAARAKSSGYRMLINCDSWANVNGTSGYNDSSIKRPVGIQVLNGKLLQNFGRTHSELSDSDQHALYMTKDYKLRHVNRGLNDAQMQKYLTDNKALFSAGYTTYLINYGKMLNFDPKDGVSARTVLGQRADGTIVIVVVHGRTGDFGANGYQCAKIMKAQNCYNAMLLDGGGSSQIYWNGKMVHPSSDKDGVRPIGGGFLAISGWTPAFNG